MNRNSQILSRPQETAGEAVYPGKEAWKNEHGNRYTPEQLREMERNWEIQIIDPDIAEAHNGD